jgi:hypothetical protein
MYVKILSHVTYVKLGHGAGDEPGRVSGRGPLIEADRPAAPHSAAFRLDPRRLDDRPPFFDLGLLQRTERTRRRRVRMLKGYDPAPRRFATTPVMSFSDRAAQPRVTGKGQRPASVWCG